MRKTRPFSTNRGRMVPLVDPRPSLDRTVIRATGGLPRAALWRLLGLLATGVILFAVVAIVPLSDARGGYSVLIGTEGNRVLIRSLLLVGPLVCFVGVVQLLAGVGKLPLATLRQRDGSLSLRFHLARGLLLARTIRLEEAVTLSLGYDPAKPGWDVIGATSRGRVVRTSTLGIVEKAELDAMAKAIRASGINARVIVKLPGRPSGG